MIADSTHQTALSRPQLARSLGFNFSWTLVGNIIYGGCQWLMLVSVARLGDPQMMGSFTMAQAIAGPIVLFGNLQLRVIQAADSNECFQFGHYLALRYLTTLTAFIAIVIWALLGKYRAESLSLILIVALAKCIESLSDIYFGLLQHHEEMSRIAKSMIIKGLLSLVALVGTLRLTHSLVFAALAMMLAWLLVFVAYDSRSPRFCAPCAARPIWDRRALSRLVHVALPLGATMLMISLNTNLPRYFIQHFQGTRRLGLFSALTAIQIAGMLVVMALGNAVVPPLARYYNDADWPGFRSTIVRFLLVSLALGTMTLLPAVLAGDWVIALIFGRDYAGQNQTFVWLALAAAISYCVSVFGYAATASGRLKFQPMASGIVAAVTALGCYWLVPAYGGLGAAITVCGAAFVGLLLFLMSFAGTCRELQTRHNQKRRAEGTEEITAGNLRGRVAQVCSPFRPH